MTALFLQVLLAYVIGSVSGALILGRLGGFDIRESGSGNAGATNALRTRGKAFALAVLVIDVGKGALAAALAPRLLLGLEPPSLTMPQVAMLCGLAATVGHVFPIFHGFRGGKGAATLTGALLVILPLLVPALIVVWLTTILLTGYVGLGTVMAALAVLPLTAWLAPAVNRADCLIFAAAAATLTLFTHRGNIVRLLHGRENRFERAVAWRRRR